MSQQFWQSREQIDIKASEDHIPGLAGELVPYVHLISTHWTYM